MNDGNVSFGQPKSNIEMSIISDSFNKNQIDEDEVDEYLPTSLPDFLDLPIFYENKLSNKFKQFIKERATCFFYHVLFISNW